MVRLGALAGPTQAQLGGFRMRAVKAEVPTQKHLYMTGWLKISEAKAGAERISGGTGRLPTPLRLARARR